jgi:hypothetical protein
MCEANVDAHSHVAKLSTNSKMTARSMAIADERVSIERHGVVMASRRRDVLRGSSHLRGDRPGTWSAFLHLDVCSGRK